MPPSTMPPKGTRDLLPGEARRRQYITRIIEAAYEAHGFEPLMTPSIETLDTLLGKYGQEGDQLIFKILKRGESLQRAMAGKGEIGEGDLADLGLRYDLTVPLARVAAGSQNALPRPFKRYQIQQVWRADRPAKGRFREFTQCDVDIVGAASICADAEVFSAAATALTGLGFSDVALMTNHRDVLFGLIEAAGIDPALEGSALVAVDKLDKIGWGGVTKELKERGLSEACVDRLRALLDVDAASNAATLDHLEAALKDSARGQKGVRELREILSLTAASPAGPLVRISPYIARGLSYYTGLIVEAVTPQLAGSIGAGGRYDGLVGMFLGRDLPAVGFSLGLDRLEVVMEALGLFPARLDGAPEVMVAAMGDPVGDMALAAALRGQGLRVDVCVEPDARLGKQFKAADGRGIRFVAIQGSEERAQGQVAIKDLLTGHQQSMGRDTVAAAIAATLRGPSDGAEGA